MAKTKISEFSSTPANNTDIDSINIAEGCAPSNINDAIRELMAQLKDFQTGAVGDSFNGPIGSSTAAAGAFTTLSATGAITSTLATGTAPLVIASTTKVANLNVDLLDGADWASPAALGSTTPAAVSATTLSASGAVTLSGGTANGVPYLNGSKVLTTGSALWFDGTNFGVGTGGNTLNQQSVVYKVGANAVYQQIANGSTGLGAANGVRLGVSNGGTGELYSPTALISYIDNSEQMRLTSTGLGIGTSSPATKLDVVGVVRATGAGPSVISVEGSAQLYAAVQLQATSSGGKNWSLVSNATSSPLGAAGSLSFRDSSVGTTHMTLDSAGNLGLGVTPSAWGGGGKPLQAVNASFWGLVGTPTFSSMGANYFYDGSYKYISSAAATDYYQYLGSHIWRTAASGTAGDAISFTQAMTLDASGNLGVGTTSQPSGVGSSRLGVVSASNDFVIAVNSTHATDPYGLFIKYTAASPNGNTNNFFYFQDSTALRAKLQSNGGIANYQANDTNLSDRREKTDFAPAGSYLDKICAIEVQTFKYNDQIDDEKTLGVVAQDVQAVAPELVTESNWGTEEEPKIRLSIYQTDLQYALMKCIQEQQAIIESLKARLDAANL